MRYLARTSFAISLAATALFPIASPAIAHPGITTAPNAVIAWNANAGKAAVAACIAPADDPLHESRMYAMTHVAIHDALNAVDRRSRPYELAAHAARGTSAVAAVASAARSVLVPVLGQLPAPFPRSCIDAGVASVEANYVAALRAIPEGTAKDRGIRLGRAAAAAILARRAGDGSDTPLIVPDYPQGTRPGEYRFTPGFTFAFAPGWGNVRPFVLRNSSQFRPGPHYPLASRQYAADFNEVKRLGGDGVTTPSARTPGQTEVARFWVESSPLAWNRIARTVAVRRGLDMWASARLFGLLNMAMADGYVGSFDTKYHDKFWRPVTAIRLAGTDGNPATSADPTWTSLVPAPPIPDYDSGHAVQGGAASQVLMRFFGTDHVRFTACSMTLPATSTCADTKPVLRHYASFSQAREENGLSRILVGFHFRQGVREGIQHGRKIANLTVDKYLRPAR